MSTNINKTNYFKNTYGEFEPCEIPNHAPDYISESGSKYWYTENGVIRLSDHWGSIGYCIWKLDNCTGEACGYIDFEDFFETTRIDDLENGIYTYYDRSVFYFIKNNEDLKCYNSNINYHIMPLRAFSVFNSLKKIEPLKVFHLFYGHGTVVTNGNQREVRILFEEGIKDIKIRSDEFKLLSKVEYSLDNGKFQKVDI